MDRRQFIRKLSAGVTIVGVPTAYGRGQLALDLEDRDRNVRDHVAKEVNPDIDLPNDIYLTPEQRPIAKSIVRRLGKLQRVVGYGNFNIISLDNARHIARSYNRVGDFPAAELEFLEDIFHRDSKIYGFFGSRVDSKMTQTILEKDIIKIPGSGHYLFRGEALKFYDQIRKDLPKKVILTSGIRSIVKQAYLFLRKADSVGGNLSRASRSLAPPGHSYHSIGDFDVGKPGFGHHNFTDKFAQTEEFKLLCQLGYVDIRYTRINPFGVRFEPWHIKV